MNPPTTYENPVIMQCLEKDLSTGEWNFPPLRQKQESALKRIVNSAIKFFLYRGGARAGKTYGIVDFMVKRAELYPRSIQIVLRRTKTDVINTTWLESFIPILEDLESLGECRVFQTGDIRCRFRNGSIIKIGGLQPGELDKVLGIQYCTIYIAEASEVSFAAFESLKSRMNSKTMHKNGRQVKPIMLLDCNPPSKGHWLYKVFELKQNPLDNKPLLDQQMYESMKFVPIDNKEALEDDFIRIQEGLSEHKRRRFLDGDYGTVEGGIFPEFDHSKHIIFSTDNKPWRPEKNRDGIQLYRALDFGYNHPTACLWGAHDRSSGILRIYREYRVAETVAKIHAQNITTYSQPDVEGGESMKTRDLMIKCNSLYKTLCDHQSEYQHQFKDDSQYGVGYTLFTAKKDVQKSIDIIKQLLLDGKLLIDRSCYGLIDEIESYRWRDNKGDDGLKDEPVKELDDLIDCLRYICNEIYTPGVKFLR